MRTPTLILHRNRNIYIYLALGGQLSCEIALSVKAAARRKKRKTRLGKRSRICFLCFPFHAHTRTGCFRKTHKVVTLLSLFLEPSSVLLRGAGEGGVG